MPQRVADEIGDHDVEAARVEPGANAGGQFGADPAVRPVPVLQGLADGLRRVDLVGVQLRRARVEAGDLHQVLDEHGELPRLGADQPDRAGGVGVQQARVLVEDLGDGEHPGERGAQFVRDVGGETAGAFLGPAQLLHGVLELARGIVEGVGEVGQFVAAPHRDAGVEPAAAHGLRGLVQFPHRTQHTARGEQTGQQGDGEAGQGTVAGGGEQRVDVDLLVGHPHDGVEDQSGGQHALRAGPEDGRHRDGQIGHAVLDDPLEAAVRIGVGGAAQLRGDDGGDGAGARRGADRTVLGEHHPGARLALAGEVAQHLLQPFPLHGQDEAGLLDLVAERRDRRVLRGLEQGVACLAIGQRGGGAGTDGRDQQERQDQPRPQPERPGPPQRPPLACGPAPPAPVRGTRLGAALRRPAVVSGVAAEGVTAGAVGCPAVLGPAVPSRADAEGVPPCAVGGLGICRPAVVSRVAAEAVTAGAVGCPAVRRPAVPRRGAAGPVTGPGVLRPAVVRPGRLPLAERGSAPAPGLVPAPGLAPARAPAHASAPALAAEYPAEGGSPGHRGPKR
ncbi:hypothetical protein SGLAM104S_09849 [Streptomyces glaucescens]